MRRNIERTEREPEEKIGRCKQMMGMIHIGDVNLETMRRYSTDPSFPRNLISEFPHAFRYAYFQIISDSRRMYIVVIKKTAVFLIRTSLFCGLPDISRAPNMGLRKSLRSAAYPIMWFVEVSGFRMSKLCWDIRNNIIWIDKGRSIAGVDPVVARHSVTQFAKGLVVGMAISKDACTGETTPLFCPEGATVGGPRYRSMIEGRYFPQI